MRRSTGTHRPNKLIGIKQALHNPKVSGNQRHNVPYFASTINK
jgi:hypothetical protein